MTTEVLNRTIEMLSGLQVWCYWTVENIDRTTEDNDTNDTGTNSTIELLVSTLKYKQ